ncbi:3788_t:CDS:2, partial [Diversispora eburnea]
MIRAQVTGGFQRNLESSEGKVSGLQNNLNYVSGLQNNLGYVRGLQNNLSYVNETNKDLRKFAEKQTVTSDFADRNYFNCIKFTKPQIIINDSNIWSESFDSNISNSNFLSIESNVYFGTSAASHAKVEKLIKLLVDKKKEIDKVFESQPEYFIGLDFHENSSVPHISCWTTEPLDIIILEKLEELFDDEFEAMNFIISAYLQAKVYSLPDERNRKNLKFSIDVNDCRIGTMLSENWPPLRKLGSGYFLDSVEIWVTPIKDESMPNKLLYKVKDGPWPQQSNSDVDISKVHESKHGISASISRDPGAILSKGIMNGQEIKSVTKEWELTVDGSCRTGLGWRYQYTAENLHKNFKRRRNFAPGIHSCHWETLEPMSGFHITINQVICCKITDGWRKLKPYTKSNLMQICPKMSHTIKITFNSLESFNENFEKLMKSKESHDDLINVTLVKKASPQIEDPNGGNIIERSVKIFTKPQISINKLDIWSDSFDSNFLSIESNVYFGTSADSHAKVEKLIELLMDKKEKIDEVFKSQSAYFIGPDFHENSSLEELFDGEFEAMSYVITSTNDEYIDEEINENEYSA